MIRNFDVIIIGAGVVGCAVARELSRYSLKTLVIEKENDVSVGTSKANSGIVHAGFDAQPGTAKARYNVWGAGIYEHVCKELSVSFRRVGAYVLRFEGEDDAELNNLLKNAEINGVSASLLSGENVRDREPLVSDKVVSALYAPDSAIVSPYGLNIAMFENARANGVDFLFNSPVSDIVRGQNGYVVKLASGEVFSCRVAVNAAGVYADVINNFICGKKLNITPRRGEYVLTDKTARYCSSTLFGLPTKLGKGVLVSPTAGGNTIMGPTADDISDKEDKATTAEKLNYVIADVRKTVPSFNPRDIITQFSGLRAHEDGGDFVIGECEDGFFNAAGIESPGLTAAPAIGAALSSAIAEKLRAEENPDFEPMRFSIPAFAAMTDKQRQDAIARNPKYGKVICRCETVTEAEIVEAIRRGAVDLDGVKRRTRAGMGRCQSGFCMPAVIDILSRELGLSPAEITKSGGKSTPVTGKLK